MGLWRWRQAINVDAPPHAVFDYLSDLSQLTEVILRNSSLTDPNDSQQSPLEEGANAQLVFDAGMIRGTKHGKLTVTEVAPNERVAWTVELDAFMARIGIPDAAFELRPIDQGTRVNMVSVYRWPLWFNILILTLWIGFLPILLISHRLQSRGRLRRLKQGVAAIGLHEGPETNPWFRDAWTGWVLLAIGGMGLWFGAIVGLTQLLDSGATSASTPLPTGPTTTTTLPSGFVTFVDDARSFTISYPSDWVVIPNDQPAQLINPDIPVFEAGRVTTDNVLIPLTTVFLGFLSQNISSDELADSNLAMWDGLVVHDRRHLAVSGPQEVATIAEVEFPEAVFEPGAAGSIHGFFLYSAGGRAIRMIQCISDSVLDLDECQAVVTSFGVIANN